MLVTLLSRAVKVILYIVPMYDSGILKSWVSGLSFPLKESP